MLNHKIKVAVLGCGYWGKNLIRNFYELGALDYVCDENYQIAKEFSNKYSCKSDSFENILKSDVSAVVIATPAFTHHDLCIKSANAGKHVFVEKPIAMNLQEVDDMIQVSKKNNTHLMVGHLLHYHPAFKKIKNLMKEEFFGDIKYVYSNRLSMGKIRSEENVIWSFAPHDISMICSVAKSEVEDVRVNTASLYQKNIADSATISIKFENGIQGHIHCSWTNPFKEHKFVLIGSKKMIVFDDTNEWNKKLEVYEHVIDQNMSPPTIEKKESYFLDIDESEPLKNESEYFLELIAGNVPPLTNGLEARKVIDILTKSTSER